MANIGKKEALKMKKIKSIGLIVEDNSDFESLSVIIKRLINKDNIKIKKALSNGCGKLRRKALSYSENLSKKGCNMIILVHDLDRWNYDELVKELTSKFSQCPAEFSFICIPTEEIEAWFLSDLHAIKATFNLDRLPKISGAPETIPSPKEKIGELVRSCSNNSKLYLNTKHNVKLSKNVSVDKMKLKCDSFSKFYDFILKHKY